MKPTGQRWHLKKDNNHQLNGLIEHIKLKWVEGKDLTVQFMSDDRTVDQNTMIYALYGDIARQADDKSVHDVMLECKLHYGVPILRAADPAFCAMWDAKFLGNKATYEEKLQIVGYLDITSKMTKKQASEYIDTIILKYTEKGFALSHEAA